MSIRVVIPACKAARTIVEFLIQKTREFLNIEDVGTFSAGADKSGQFHRWTLRQYVGPNCLKTSPPVRQSEPTLPGKLSGPYTDLSTAFEIVPRMCFPSHHT